MCRCGCGGNSATVQQASALAAMSAEARDEALAAMPQEAKAAAIIAMAEKSPFDCAASLAEMSPEERAAMRESVDRIEEKRSKDEPAVQQGNPSEQMADCRHCCRK